ncbi:hypothetical protein [Halobacterium sp. CBA1126]|uniref:hypothetical protein n=1 Tax=Halobacterium sp. CBA1126 TaxID=2668074 RepID=UPI0012F97919|nr:hypothetical protein [Halobacterium sp. CBA1126]MUV61555.1 hypothetical protein [Halobacterium sp. CBA1126]
MTSETPAQLVVECPECPFSTVVGEDDRSAAVIVREHGAKTGHAARIAKVESEE